jgi:uncharacterized protein YecT (DUF1311 family)
VKIAAVLALSSSALLTASQSYDWSDDTQWDGFEESKAICRSVRNLEPPASDRPTLAQARALQDCSSEALYYGIGIPPDPVRARQCAFLEMDSDEGLVFGDRSMLMTMYANGVGAQRNLDVAIHLACGIEGAPAEVDGRVRHLAELRDTHWTGNDFHLCDDVTSGLMMGHCSGHAASIAEARRAAVLVRLAAGWSEAQRRAFAPLQQAEQAYAHARAEEIDLTGSARGAFAVTAEEQVNEEFLRTLDQLEGSAAPDLTHAQFEAADGELNRVYRELMRAEHFDCPGCVTAEGIRAAQRAWLRYRDAFLAFAAVRYPQLQRDSLSALLTRQRIAILREGAENSL